MLKNYITIAFRSLLRSKSYTFINIIGLSLGITTCLIIFLIIRYEMNYDRFHPDGDRIYRVANDFESASGIQKSSIVPYPLGEAMRNDFSDLKAITELHYHEEAVVTAGADKFQVNSIVFADSSFFKVFGFEVLSGNPVKELAQPGKVFLSEDFARNVLKGDVKHIKINNMLDLEVVGIIKTPPSPSHIAFNMIVSWPTLTPEFLGFPLTEWSLTSSGYTYVKLPAQMHKESVEARFPALVKKYYGPEDAEHSTLSLQPLAGLHFDTVYIGNPGGPATSLSTVYVLAFIGLFLLLIACVNFINLSTALSVRKSKEVGVRKTLGAQRSQLAMQYMSEAFMITAVAAIISVVMAQWMVPLAGNFLNKSLALNFFHNVPVMLFLGGLVIVTSVFSGMYPALVLSRFNPVKALKSRVTDPGSSSSVLRKSLVVFQFFIAQVLIICTLVVSSQLSFFRETPLGFQTEAVVNVGLPYNDAHLLESLRNKLLSNSNISEVAMAVGAPLSKNNFNTYAFLTEKGSDDRHDVSLKPIDFHYQEVYGLELVEGRWFTESEANMPSRGEVTKMQRPYILTESAVKALGFAAPKDIIGKNITSGLYSISGPVVGVLKDFNTASLKSKMNPVVLVPFARFFYDAGIKITGNDMPGTLKFIQETWEQTYPEDLYQYAFLDQYIGKLYAEEEQMFTLFQIFAGIAILIGCLGLYGLVSFIANQRVKEVAIRKTLGASVAQIVGLFSKEFVVLVVLAFVVAAPVAAYAMTQWLQTFAYQVPLGWPVFATGILFTLVIAFGTVGYRSLRAALSNPVDALKSE